MERGRFIKDLAVKVTLLLWGVVVCFANVSTQPVVSAAEASANATGWAVNNGKQYYYLNGKKVTNWQKLNGKWYFFKASNGVLVKDSIITWKGQKYYLDTNGVMATGWVNVGSAKYCAKSSGELYTGWFKYDKKKYYSDPSSAKVLTKQFLTLNTGKYWLNKNGVMVKNKWISVKKKWYFTDSDGRVKEGWLTRNGATYYLVKGSGVAATGWKKIDGKYYYFDPSYVSCQMKKGFQKIDGKTYYLGTNGVRQSGLITVSGKKYYFDASGIMQTGWVTISGASYYFKSSGEMATNTTVDGKYLGSDGKVTTASSNMTVAESKSSVGSKTIKGLLQNALLPIGSTMYIWGGGHDDADGMRIGVNPNWKTFYNKQTSSYNFNNYQYKYGYGLDCSGYVGWTIYNTIYKKSGQSYLTQQSTGFPANLASKGWGTCSKTTTSTRIFKPGDIVSMSGHVWIVVGQCSDGSVVIAHATPPVLQLSGTVASDGTKYSEAVKLATDYMKKYFANCYNKYKNSSGYMTIGTAAYTLSVNRFTWNVSGSKMMSDPENIRQLNASQVLKRLFGG